MRTWKQSLIMALDVPSESRNRSGERAEGFSGLRDLESPSVRLGGGGFFKAGAFVLPAWSSFRGCVCPWSKDKSLSDGLQNLDLLSFFSTYMLVGRGGSRSQEYLAQHQYWFPVTPKALARAGAGLD